MKRTVLSMLDQAAGKWGSAPFALRKTDAGWTAVSFTEARTRAREFAAWLLATGLKKGDSIAILAEGSPEWIIGELGMLMVGLRVRAAVDQAAGEEIPFRLNHSEAKSDPDDEKPAQEGARLLRLGGEQVDPPGHPRRRSRRRARRCSRLGNRGRSCHRLRRGPGGRAAAMDRQGPALEACIAAVEEDDTVTICYTSGTTGNPKGIMLTHLNYWTNCHDGVKVIAIPQGWRSLIILPVDHSFAHTAGLYTALVCAIALYFVDARGGGIAILRNIPINLLEVNPHFLFTVPAISGNFMKKIIAGVEEKGGIIEKLFKVGDQGRHRVRTATASTGPRSACG